MCRVLTGGRTVYWLAEDVQGVELREKLIDRKYNEKLGEYQRASIG